MQNLVPPGSEGELGVSLKRCVGIGKAYFDTLQRSWVKYAFSS